MYMYMYIHTHTCKRMYVYTWYPHTYTHISRLTLNPSAGRACECGWSEWVNPYSASSARRA